MSRGVWSGSLGSALLTGVLLASVVGLWIWQFHRVVRSADQVIADSDRLWQQGHYNEAIDVLDRALAQGALRRSQALHLRRAHRLMALDRLDDAATEFRAWALPPAQDVNSAMAFAQCLEAGRRSEEAEKILRAIIAADPDGDPGVITKLAEILLKRAIRTADFSQRRALMDDALNLLMSQNWPPDHFPIYENQLKAAIMIDRGDPESALMDLLPSQMPRFTGASESGQLESTLDLGQYYMVVAAVYMRLGRVKEAQATISSVYDVMHAALQRVRENAARSDSPLAQAAPFMPGSGRSGIVVVHSFVAIDAILIEGAVWNGRSPDWQLMAWRVSQMRRLSRYGVMSASSEVLYEGAPPGDIDGLLTNLKKGMFAISHYEMGVQCPPGDLIITPAFMGTLQVLTGDLQHAAGRDPEARAAYKQAERLPFVTALARLRLKAPEVKRP